MNLSELQLTRLVCIYVRVCARIRTGVYAFSCVCVCSCLSLSIAFPVSLAKGCQGQRPSAEGSEG